MIYSLTFRIGIHRFGSNWNHRQDDTKETERPFNSPTVRNSRNLHSRTYSSTVSSGIGSILGNRRLDPTDEAFRTYPENFFGGRTGMSISVMRYTNLSCHSRKTLYLRKGIEKIEDSVSIRGQRMSKGTSLTIFAISESRKSWSRRVPGSSKRHCSSTFDAPPTKYLAFRRSKNFCLRNSVVVTQDVLPEGNLDGVLEAHRRVLPRPENGPFTNSRRDESIE